MEGKNPKAAKGFTAKVSGDEYEPYIAHDSNVKEFTVRAVIIGCVLAMLFGAANAYLALQIGMTICASIPAAVIGLAVLRGCFKDSSVLENNIVQTVGSSGEALAAGVAFTLPALLLLDIDVKIVTVFVIAAVGGLIGCLLMVPLRKFLIKDEHGKLPYPEGTACAEVVVAGHEGGSNARLLFEALGLGALYKFLTDGVAVFPYTIDLPLKGYLKGGAVGMDYLGSLLGAGFLVGPRICAMSLAGGVLGWVVIMPLIFSIGSMAPELVIPPADIPIAQMDIWDLWTNYIKYIGIGSVTMGGFISLFTALPIIETQAGDVSAYIPTNVISITDGQIFLESDLFFSGMRPAVNVGLSVSRVGGAAQTKAMKKAAGSIRIDLAQYREMEVFTQFSSDLDPATVEQLKYGKGLMELLKQPLCKPFSMPQQVIMLCAATGKVMIDVPVEKIREFRTGMLDYFAKSQPVIVRELETTGQLSDSLRDQIVKAAEEYRDQVWNKEV